MASSLAELCSQQVADEKMKKMKIMICTTKVRPDGAKTVFPPIGALAIIQALKKAGYENTYLYDIDCFRPSLDEIKKKLLVDKPDVIGISGVVSTAYKFIKALLGTINENLPETLTIVGGNVAANSEILLKIAKANYCVVGEGELAAIELLNYIKDFRHKKSVSDNFDQLKKIKGLCYLDKSGVAVLTGYQANIPAEELYHTDYEILKKHSNLDAYIINPFFYHHFVYDRRSFEPHRAGKKLATLVSTKGCVAKCTFCHRWDHSIRFVPVDLIIERIKYLKENHNVGFISFSDENWGSWSKWNDEFIEKIKPLDILWRAGGVRTRSVSLDLLKKMREAGCSNVQYGMETGSQKMLEVMEKKLKLEDNINAATWTNQANLYTTYSMVIGMPGENTETINETADFLKQVTGILAEEPYARLSINRLEALPGTPVYEYAKQKGWIGKTPEEEEKYLLWISDTDGGEFWKQINFTDQPDFIVQSWRRLIWLEVMHNWYKLHPEKIIPISKVLISSLGTYFKSLEERIKMRSSITYIDKPIDGDSIDSIIDKNWNAHMDAIQKSFINVRYHPIFYKFKKFIILETVVRGLFMKGAPKKVWIENLSELIMFYFKSKKNYFDDYRSLRKVVADKRVDAISESEKNLLPLQLGR